MENSNSFDRPNITFSCDLSDCTRLSPSQYPLAENNSICSNEDPGSGIPFWYFNAIPTEEPCYRPSSRKLCAQVSTCFDQEHNISLRNSKLICDSNFTSHSTSQNGHDISGHPLLYQVEDESFTAVPNYQLASDDFDKSREDVFKGSIRKEPMGSENKDISLSVVTSLHCSSELNGESHQLVSSTNSEKPECVTLPVSTVKANEQSLCQQVKKDSMSFHHPWPPIIGQSFDISSGGCCNENNDYCKEGSESEESKQSWLQSESSGEDQDTLSQRVEALLGEKIIYTQDSEESCQLKDSSNDNWNENNPLQEQTNSDKIVAAQEMNQHQNRDFFLSNQMSVNKSDSEIKTNYSKSKLTDLPIKANEIKLLKIDAPYFPNCDLPYSNDTIFPTVNLGQKTSKKKLEDGHQSNTDLEERGLLGTGEERVLSPLSMCSATSSRRLEWDSGADIGYPVSPTCCRAEPEGYSSILTDKVLVINKREKGIQTLINEDNSLEDTFSVSGESVSSECILESLYDKQCFSSPCDTSHKQTERKQLIDKVHHILQSSRAKRLKAQETNNLLGRTLVSRTEDNVNVLKNQNCVADNEHSDDCSTPDCSIYNDLEILKITNSLCSLNVSVGVISSRKVSSQPLVTWIYTNPSINSPQVSVTHNTAPLSCIKDLFGGETKETSVVEETNYQLCDGKFIRGNDTNCNDKSYFSNRVSVCHDNCAMGTLCHSSQTNLSSVVGCNNKETQDIQQNEESKDFQIHTDPAGKINLSEVQVKDISDYNVQTCNESQWENTQNTFVRNKTNENSVSVHSIFSHYVKPAVQDFNQSPGIDKSNLWVMIEKGENQQKNLPVNHISKRLVNKSMTDQENQLKEVVNIDKQNVENRRAFRSFPYNKNFSQEEHFTNSHCLENIGREQLFKFNDSKAQDIKTGYQEIHLAPINSSALLILENSKYLHSDLKKKDSQGFERDAEKSSFACETLISSHLPDLMKPNVSEAQTSKLFQVIKTDTTMSEGSYCATEVGTRIKSPLKYSSQLPSVEKNSGVFYPVGTPADQHKIKDASLLSNSHTFDPDKDSNSTDKHVSAFSTKFANTKQHFKLPSVQCVSKHDQCFSQCRIIPIESNQHSVQEILKDISSSANHAVTKESKSYATFSECANANVGHQDNHKELSNEIHVPSFETWMHPSTVSMNTHQRSPESINTDLNKNHQKILATFKTDKEAVSETCQVCGFKSRSIIHRQKQLPNRLSTEQSHEMCISYTPLYLQSASQESVLSSKPKCRSCISTVTDTSLTDDPTIISEKLQKKFSCKQLPQWEKYHKQYNVPSAWHLSGSLENLLKKSQPVLERSTTTSHHSLEDMEKEVVKSRSETDQLGVNSYVSVSHSKNSLARPSKKVLLSDELSSNVSERKSVKAPWEEYLYKLNTLTDCGESATSVKQNSSGEERYDEDFRSKNVQGEVRSEKINSYKDHTSLKKEGKKTVLQAHQQSRTKSPLHSARHQNVVYPVRRKRETAKKELEKLKHLVDRQKKSYLHRLQREVERLERLGKLFQESSPTDDDKASSVYTKVQEISESWSSAKGTTSSASSSFCTVKTKTLSKHADLSNLYDHYPAQKLKRKVLHSACAQEMQKLRMDEKGELSNYHGSKFTHRRKHIEKTPPELVSVCVQTQVEPQEGTNKHERQFVSTGLLSSFERKKFACQKGKNYRNQRINSAKKPLRKMTPPSVSWFVPVTINVRKNNQSEAFHKHLQETGKITLQDAFNKHCSHLIKNSQQRLQNIASLAEFRKHHSAKYVMNGHISHKRRSHRISKTFKDNHQQKRKIFSHWEMRQQTEKVYQNLPEVVKKSENARRAQEYKNNQLKVHIYNQKLKERVLKGKVSLPITQQCCRTAVHELAKQPAE